MLRIEGCVLAVKDSSHLFWKDTEANPCEASFLGDTHAAMLSPSSSLLNVHGQKPANSFGYGNKAGQMMFFGSKKHVAGILSRFVAD